MRPEHAGTWTIFLTITLASSGFLAFSNYSYSSNHLTPLLHPFSLCSHGLSRPTFARIALVRPDFTVAAYSQSPHQRESFYDFYPKYANYTHLITSDLGWLVAGNLTGLTKGGGWGDDQGLFSLLNSTSRWLCSHGFSLYVVSDADVHQGILHSSLGRTFDAAIVGHEEYVSQKEYNEFKGFVATGGRLVIASADAFEVKVNFSSITGAEKYVEGHGYKFNGTCAWHSHFRPFDVNNTKWIGSIYRSGLVPSRQWNPEISRGSHFGPSPYGKGAEVNMLNPIGSWLAKMYGPRIFRTYFSHEENIVTNMTGTSVVAKWGNYSGLLVASYVHTYVQGSTICLCVYGEQLVEDPAFKTFLFISSTSDYNRTLWGNLGPPNLPRESYV